jgi:hypothetical protein
LSFTFFLAHHSFSVTSFPLALASFPLTRAIKDKTRSPSRIQLAISSLTEAVEWPPHLCGLFGKEQRRRREEDQRRDEEKRRRRVSNSLATVQKPSKEDSPSNDTCEGGGREGGRSRKREGGGRRGRKGSGARQGREGGEEGGRWGGREVRRERNPRARQVRWVGHRKRKKKK